MPINLELAESIRTAVNQVPLNSDEVISEKKMFGGLCFLINGKMMMGIDNSRIMLRLNDEDFDEFLSTGKVRPMDFTGRPLKNFAFLSEGNEPTVEELIFWATRSVSFVRHHMLSKPQKSKGARTK